MQKIFTIPAGMPFAKALASSLLEEHTQNPETLPDYLILLPTRRACRTLREAFLQLNNGKPLMLPALQAIGDIDEEELSLSMSGQQGVEQRLDLPPVLPDIQRQILLARAIQEHEDFPHSFNHALSLAKTLSHLMDQIYTENLDIRDLADLVPEDFADHWQITLDFLKILSETWPKILTEMGVIDSADRRNRLINALADFWDETKPEKHIIAAGTTGSIPATAKLLNTIYNLPNGQIILPGLDEHIDDQSWENIKESHPQYGFKLLLGSMNIDRKNVEPWPHKINNSQTTINRHRLASELMRPAETTKEWQNLEQDSLNTTIENLKVLDCDNPQHEAQIIASLMRQTIEDPSKTAALITPDRKLAKRVSIACRRWNIAVDDSAGQTLTQTQIGRFLLLSIKTCINDLSPVSLLALLKHKLTNDSLKTNLKTFEVLLLRGFKPANGIEGLRHQLAKKEKNESLETFIDTLESLFSSVLKTIENSAHIDFKTLLQTHITLCEALHNGENLWEGDDGNAASTLLSELLSQAHSFPKISATEYPEILQQFLNSITLRPAYGTHPRLQILGQLEARLIDADLVILSGLNEGTWPPDPGYDPWMSGYMRTEFGLPGNERSIGLSAHDFIQGLCAPNVAMTRSKLIDGAPAVPARWLTRLETVLNAANIDIKTLRQNDISQWLSELDQSEASEPYKRPAPKPPLNSRPRKLSVTKIETWLKDPYSIYAYSILNLRKLEPLEKQADTALRGEILHEALHHFITQHPDSIPNNAAQIILESAHNFIAKENLPEEDWHFYWPRFNKITNQFLEKETAWRKKAKPLKTEVKGETKLETKIGDFILYGRADRIDQTAEGLAIIDYKSGGNFTKKGFENGDTPQLPLEGVIAQSNGFEDIKAKPCNYLGYWVLNSKTTNIENHDPQDVIAESNAALITLIDTFDDGETPYYATPRANKIPRFNDYEHLARTKEWATLDDPESDAA